MTRASTGAHAPADEYHTLVGFDGPRLLDAHGLLLAELREDGHWYTSEGLPCTGLALPAPQAQPQVRKSDRDAARREADKAWIDAAYPALVVLAEQRGELTSDDLWAALSMPPRESRMIGNVFSRARNAGALEPTSRHTPSVRPENHGRPVRVWRSLLYRQGHLC